MINDAERPDDVHLGLCIHIEEAPALQAGGQDLGRCVLIDSIEEQFPEEFVEEMVRPAEARPGILWREVSEERKRRR